MACSSSMKSAKQPFCPTCRKSKLTESRCPICDQLYCDVCITKHSHKFKQVPCKDHEGYFYTNICIKCDKFVCPMCLSKTHQGHRVEVINEYCNTINNRLEKNRRILVNKKLPEISQNIDDLELLKRFHEASVEEEKKKISDEKEEYMKIIKSHYDNLIDELEEKSMEIIKSISKDINEQEQNLADMKRKIRMTDETKLNGDILQICQNTKKISEYVETCDTEISLCHREIITFVPQGDLLKSIDKTKLGALTNSELPIEKFLKQEIQESYDIEGVVCPESSIAASTDGTIWVTNNDNLIQIQNGRQQIISRRQKIVDIAATKDNDLLIIFKNENCIHIFKQNDSCITLFYSIPKNRSVMAMDVCSDGRIFVLCCKQLKPIMMVLFNEVNCHVVVLSQNGAIKACIDARLPFFHNYFLGRFRIRGTSSGIFIADCHSNDMYCLNEDGDLLTRRLSITGDHFDFLTKEIFRNKRTVLITSSTCSLSWYVPTTEFKLKDVKDKIISACYKNNNEVVVLTLKRIYIVKLIP